MDGDNNTHVKIEMENMNRNAQPFHEICKLIRKTESQYKNLPNHLKEIQSVLERNPNVIFESDNNGRNILHVIASQRESNNNYFCCVEISSKNSVKFLIFRSSITCSGAKRRNFDCLWIRY